jgi:ATP-dependent Lon protease
MTSDTTITVQTDSGQALNIPAVLPLVPLTDLVAFPYMMFPLVVSEPGLLELADDALAGSKMIGLFPVTPEDEDGETPAGGDAPGEGAEEDGHAGPGGDADPLGKAPTATSQPASRLAPIGTAAIIHKMLRFPDGGMRLLVQGMIRVRLVETVQDSPYLKGRIEVIDDDRAAGRREEALRRNAQELFQKLVDATTYLSDELKVVALNIENAGRLADFLGANLNLKYPEKLGLLEQLDPERRLEKVTAFMVRELDILALGRSIQNQVQTEMEKTQREFYLRQQMKAIQKELGGDDDNAELDELKKRIEESNMPQAAMDATMKEFERLTRMPPQAAEYTVARTYIDWMLQLPWEPAKRPPIDIDKAQKILDEDHYDLQEVKERILEYLAVRKLNQHPRSPILCLSGPPGVGKTSLGQSIARATERPFVRLSLGGLHDEAEIRGHRRTYIGSMPGRIVQGIAQAAAMDPIFMLDEVDKVGADFRGDPTSALLEVLDPAQNHAFQDNYLNVAYDLSQVLFITTANALYTIPAPLRDRMEVIELPGYTTRDKVEIARRYLVPKALADNGITSRHLRLSRSALSAIAAGYTREAGVRNLEREIHRVARKVATRVARGKRPRVSVTAKNLSEYLGQPKVFREIRERRDRVGVVTGLAWTPFGGEILFVEATRMPGRGNLTLTGQLGGVMRESAQAALSYVRTHAEALGATVRFEESDFHIHVPAGAMPKDGPSAGVAMVAALASLVSERPVRSDTAMTGEISLRGTVLPIGGLKQKVLGAARAGIKRIILPQHNENDLDEVPPDVKSGLTFIKVQTIEEVLEHALSSVRKRTTRKARATKAGKTRAKKTGKKGKRKSGKKAKKKAAKKKSSAKAGKKPRDAGSGGSREKRAARGRS